MQVSNKTKSQLLNQMYEQINKQLTPNNALLKDKFADGWNLDEQGQMKQDSPKKTTVYLHDQKWLTNI